jgi:ABC-2 type transport system permease protein
MLAIFLYNFKRSRGQILGWGIGLALLAAYLMVFYDTLIEQREQMQALLEQYPPELMAFFGGTEDLFSPAGYINSYFFSYMPLVLGIFAVLAGSGLLVSDEESGILDLLLAYPVSRAKMFWGRLAAFLASLLGILVIAWLGFVIAIPGTNMEAAPLQLTLPFVSLFTFLFLVGGLSILLSFLLPARRMAAMTSGLLLVASYFITSLSTLDENLEGAASLSPVTYLQGGYAMGGLNWSWLLGLLGFGMLFVLLAWLLFERRDIRVGGEGGWRISGFGRRRQPVS